MKQLTLILLLFFALSISAQKRSGVLFGKIKFDSLSVENIHIFNKNTEKGTISNKKGEFNIVVKLNDTLMISGLQFYLMEIEINEKILEKKYIEIELLQKINTLSEVEIKAHNLIGNLSIDSKKFMDTLNEANPLAVSYENIDFSVPSKFVAEQLDPDRLPDVTDPMIPVGGDLLGLASMILKPLAKEVKKIGKRKRDIKNEEREYQNNLKTVFENIRSEFGDAFFIKTLHIPLEKIDAFIIYCESYGIVDLFLKNKRIELIDLLIRESNNFNNN